MLNSFQHLTNAAYWIEPGIEKFVYTEKIELSRDDIWHKERGKCFYL